MSKARGVETPTQHPVAMDPNFGVVPMLELVPMVWVKGWPPICNTQSGAAKNLVATCPLKKERLLDTFPVISV